MSDALAEIAGGVAWKEVILQAIAESVDSKGVFEGLTHVMTVIELLNDDKVPDLSQFSLRTASNLLAEFQNTEADRKNQTWEFIEQVSKTLGQILSGLIKGIL